MINFEWHNFLQTAEEISQPGGIKRNFRLN